MDSFRKIIKMGANLSTFKRSSSTRSGTCNSSSTGASLIELLRPGCLKSEKNNGKKPLTPEKKKKNNVISTSSTTSIANITAGESSFTTLGEWLLSSPGSKPDNMSGGELCVLRSHYSSRRVHPSSSSSSSKRPHTYDHAALGSKASDSFSIQRLVINGEDETADANLDNMTSSLSRTQSENKSKKKVSFRLPEEADIIMFYPSEEMFTDCEQDSV